jgi:hypothetical protein
MMGRIINAWAIWLAMPLADKARTAGRVVRRWLTGGHDPW